MDPVSDLPPMAADHLTPPATGNHAHPPYTEMIIAAITALKDKDGSSRQAISKYIEKEFSSLPPTHSTLLTHHLKRLKNIGQLVLAKNSYMLPRSGHFQPPGLEFSATSGASDLASGSVKRKPGRPPKLNPVPGLVVHNQMAKVQAYNADVPAYQPQFEYQGQNVGDNYGPGSDFQGNSAGGSEPLFASLGLGDDGVVVPPPQPVENTPVVVKRGRGRPPKSAGGHVVGSSGGGEIQSLVSGSDVGGGEIQGGEAGSGLPGRKPNGVRVKRGVGRPRRVGFGAVTVPLSVNYLRPRGRPKRVGRPNVAVNAGAGVSGLRRRGRPSRNVIADSNGKPLGRISKSGPGTAILVTDPEQLVVYQELKSKYEHLQLKVKQVASMVKLCIDPDYGNTALGALQELEDMAAEVNVPSHGQTHEPAPAPQI